MLNNDQALSATNAVLDLSRAEDHRLDVVASYLAGTYPSSAYVPRKVQNRAAGKEYASIIARSRQPVLSLPVETLSQNLFVDGYRPARSADNAVGWEHWQANRMDARQIGVNRGAISFGAAYLVVLPGEPVPVWRPVSARRMRAMYADRLNDEWPELAVEEWVEATAKGQRRRFRLYDAERVYEMAGDLVSPLTLVPPAGVSGPTEFLSSSVHGTGVCPVVRFTGSADLDGACLGEVEPLIPLQQQIDAGTYYIEMAQQYAVHRQRWVTGMAVPEDDSGNPVEPFDAAVDRLWVGEDQDTKFGEFEQTEVKPWLDAREAALRAIAIKSQTPPGYMLGEMANLPLALTTTVPTPSGMSTMGELRVGDEVFDPTGATVKVRSLSPVYLNSECFRLTFDDGTTVVADGDHKWQMHRYVIPGRTAKSQITMTTRDLAAGGRGRSIWRKNGTKRVARWWVPVAAPFDLPEADLPIEPYTLGVWLGDGCATTGVITAHQDDAPAMVANLRDAGNVVLSRPAGNVPGEARVTITISFDREKCPRGHARARGTKTDVARCPQCAHAYYVARRDGTEQPPVTNRSFPATLKAAGLWKNKHIPEEYFWGSYKQRLALLQGLMDTDGTAYRDQGSVKLAFHDERLGHDAHRLILSLGHKARLVEKVANHKRFGPAMVYIACWTALDPVFRLERKAALQQFPKAGQGKGQSPLRRHLVAVEPIDSVPVRCITVDSSAHMFCITESFLATSNSAEALAATEAPAQRRASVYRTLLGEAYEQAFRLDAKQAGDEVGWEDTSSQVVWRDTESRSLAQVADALGKMAVQLGIPPRALWEKVPGVTDQDLAAWEAIMVEDQRRGADLAARSFGVDVNQQPTTPAAVEPATT